MKIIFAGTPEFAVPVLKALQQTKHDIVMVLTQADKPSGRGRKITPSPVKEYALQHDLPIYQPTTLKNSESFTRLEATQADIMIVIAYGLIVPKAILELPKFGCICVHLSLLPRWRGAAPAQRALLAGDTITGVTLFKMDPGIDTGEILTHAALNIDKHETTETLYHRLGELGAQTLLEKLPALEHGEVTFQTQDEDSMTYAVKIDKEEAQINWQLSAQQIERMTRAFNPWPIAYTLLNNERLRFWRASVIKELTDAPPGMIIGVDKRGIDVACGAGILRVTELQWPGGKAQTAQQAINANNSPLKIGVILGEAPPQAE
jgi:methionyl-tRNA formyltransferase